MNTATDDMRAWVGCLACYNGGRLVGRWVDASEAGELTVTAVHEGSDIVEPDEEWSSHEELWVFDHEGFDGLLSGECSPAEATRIAEAIDALPDYIDREAFVAWIGDDSTRELDDVSGFEDAYCGEWDSERAYAEDYADSAGLVPDDVSWPMTCIDWEMAARELFYDVFSIETPHGGIWVFNR